MTKLEFSENVSLLNYNLLHQMISGCGINVFFFYFDFLLMPDQKTIVTEQIFNELGIENKRKNSQLLHLNKRDYMTPENESKFVSKRLRMKITNQLRSLVSVFWCGNFPKKRTRFHTLDKLYSESITKKNSL